MVPASSRGGSESGSSLYGVYWNSPLSLRGGVGGSTIGGEGARGRESVLEDETEAASGGAGGSKLVIKSVKFY
jgi:hypothetical protein